MLGCAKPLKAHLIFWMQTFCLARKQKIISANNEGFIRVMKYSDSNDDEWLLRFDKKGNDVYRKHSKVLIEPIAEGKDKKKGRKTNQVLHVEREEGGGQRK